MSDNAAKKKLEEYRRRKERELYIKEAKLKAESLLKNLFSRGKTMKSSDEQLQVEPAEDPSAKLLQDDEQEYISDSDFIKEETAKPLTYVDYMYYVLWFVLWLILYIIFIELEFGLVYLVMSGLVAMYINTRTTPRKPNEASAYSVFNKNCESIDGTLKAEQFERELIYGPAAMR